MPRARTVAVLLLVLTVGQLAVATFVPTLPQFEGKAFGSRLVAYPVLMLLLPAVFALARRRSRPGSPDPLPWAAFAWVMVPFLVDVTGNTFDLYDTVTWWDDANHFVNWFFLSLGCGLLLAAGGVAPRWALGLCVAGLGALLAIGWELGEWFTFIRHGTELDTAYTDTLGDEVLGCLGAAVAALVVIMQKRPVPAPGEPTADVSA
ncbi:hypothetical protein ACIB24_06110 [Spongisporangium articulatum]|uniref:VanZ like family protein n=1 Tax=Spongisporangium articulatum TaxID=3362603 RepID=A0ABW8AJU2_9ACTN